MNGKQAKRIRREVMKTLPAANLPARLVEIGYGRTIHNEKGEALVTASGPMHWHHSTQRSQYKKAKNSFKNCR